MNWLKLVDVNHKWEHTFGNTELSNDVHVEYIIFEGSSCRISCFSLIDDDILPKRWFNKGFNAVSFKLEVLHFISLPRIGINPTGICKIELVGVTPSKTITIYKKNDNDLVFSVLAKNVVISDIEGFTFG